STLDSKAEPNVVGYRIVHGGTKYFKPTRLTDEVLQDLENLSDLAPLHNPPALAVAKKALKKWPKAEHWAVFDTSFFTEMPSYTKIYALPLELTEKYQIFRYGFHGISHQYVAQEAARRLKKDLAQLKLITCHLGAGCSITALEDGQPIDTSMGFTPLEGLVMATRSGDIGPAVVSYLCQKTGLGFPEIIQTLNEKSGLLGISGLSSDLRQVIQKAQEGKKSGEEINESVRRAGLALQIYAYRVKKYIGAYWAALGGLDALVFTGAVGENCELIREMICHGLDVLGDFKTLVIPTNEELQIAREITKNLNGAH
ncbi:acetate/propionate family kinase, partial [Candidatus Parcubacteria bacterium]|nr:acetate/propionate family kinase [Candidatus Parcubacteria bacterium]